MIRRHQHQAALNLTEGELIRLIAAQRGISETEAAKVRAKDRLSEQELQRQLDARRAKAGNPVFKPRSDYTGQVRRC